MIILKPLSLYLWLPQIYPSICLTQTLGSVTFFVIVPLCSSSLTSLSSNSCLPDKPLPERSFPTNPKPPHQLYVWAIYLVLNTNCWHGSSPECYTWHLAFTSNGYLSKVINPFHEMCFSFQDICMFLPYKFQHSLLDKVHGKQKIKRWLFLYTLCLKCLYLVSISYSGTLRNLDIEKTHGRKWQAWTA